MTPPDAVTDRERQDVAISAAADALLAVCALQTGIDPQAAAYRALAAVGDVLLQAEAEAANR